MMTVLAMLAAGSALAQQPATAPQSPPPSQVHVIYQQHETVDFDVQLIRGRVFRPEEMFISVRQPGQFPVMISERSHFKAELSKSAVDLR